MVATDVAAVEPHSTHYQEINPTNTGAARFSIPTNWPGQNVFLELSQGVAEFGRDYNVDVLQRPNNASIFSSILPSVFSEGNKLRFYVNSGVQEIEVRIVPIRDAIETENAETLVIEPDDTMYPYEVSDPYGGVVDTFNFTGSATITITDASEPLALSASPASVLESNVSPPPATLRIFPSTSGVHLAGVAYLRFDTNGTGRAIPNVDFTLARRDSVPIEWKPGPVAGIYETENFSISGGEVLVDVSPVNNSIFEGSKSIVANLRTRPVHAQPDTSWGTATIVINDDDVPRTVEVELTTSDGSAEEPHHIHYLNQPANNGSVRFLTFPPEWTTHTITLDVSGTATLDSTPPAIADYELRARSIPPHSGLILSPSTGTRHNLTVPSGVSEVFIDVIPKGDILDPPPVSGESSESVIITVSPQNQQFSGALNTRITVSGSGVVTISDVLENLAIVAEDATAEEYRSEAVYDAFKITPASTTAGIMMRNNAFLRIDATAANSATPGNHPESQGPHIAGGDYRLRRRDTGAWVVINPVAGSPGIFETMRFSIHEEDEVFLDVVPLEDKVREGDEPINVKLMADEPHLGIPREHGTATLTIKELYFTTQKESDPTPDPCNCPCACRDDVEVDLQTGSFELLDASGVVQYESADQNSERPTFILKLNLPDGKAIPTQVLITANIIEADNTSTGRLGRRQVADGQVYSAVVAIDAINFTETTAGDRFVLISIQPDLSQALDKIPAASRAGLNQGVVNLEILVHPLSFKPIAPNASTPLTAHKYSGWFGIHSHFLTDRSRSGISPGNAPGQILSGVDRAAPSATILVPQTSGAGAASGAVQAESGLAYFRADGSAAWFKGKTTSPPNTLSTIAGNTITKRDGSKRVFDSVGNMVQSIDPQGNITTFTYSNSRVTGITDPLGRQTTIAYPSSSATDNRFTITRPNSEVSSFSYNQSTGVQTVTHTDPDGSGPRQSLVEVWTFSDGLLRSRVQRAANGSGESRTTSFTYDFNSAGVGQVRGTRRLKSFTRPDGGTTTIDRAQLNEGLIINGANLSVSQLLSFDVAPRKSYRNETIITDPRGGITIYRLGASGHLLGMIDPEQVARLYPGQSASTIAASTPSTALATLRDQLSYRFDIAAPTRDMFGNITGQYLGLPTQTVTPDPDLIVNGATTVSNGPRGRQTTVHSFTNGNRTGITLPGLPNQSITYNDTFDIPTLSIDENGTRSVRTVDSFGLVTNQQVQLAPSPWQNQTDRFDVTGDGIVTSLDSLRIINFLSPNGPQYVIPHPAPPTGNFFDVNGDGTVTSLDANLVINEISRRNRGLPPSPPLPPTVLANRSLAYSTPAPGLPRGLVTQERVVTGRASGDIITDYEYITASTPGSTVQQRGQLLRMIVAPGTAEQAITSYAYDDRGNLTRITDPMNRVTRFYYDNLNRITATLGPDPDAAGPLLGPATRFDYDVFNNVIATETINSYLEGSTLYVTATKSSITYNGIDLPTNRFDQNPAVTWYLTGTSLAQSTTKASGAAIRSAALEAYLNANSIIVNTPLSSTTNRGLTTTYSYSPAGDLLSVTETATGTTLPPRTTTFDHDRLGRTTQIVTPNPGTGLTTTATDVRQAGAGYITAFAYDNLSNLLSTTDPLGNRTSQTYDDLNRITSQTMPHATVTGAAGPTTNYAYTQTGRGWDITSTNANGQVVVQKTDALRRTTSISGDVPTQSWTYFIDGQLATSADAINAVTDFDYTLRGQLRTVTEPTPVSGNVRAVKTYQYFADGQVSSMTDPLGRVTSYSYLPSGRVGTITQPDPDGAGSLLASNMSYVYDAIGNLRTQTDSLGNATRFDYDSLFRQTSTTDPRNAVTRTGYTLFNEVSSITDPLNNVTQYLYNNVGNLVTERQVVSGTNLDRTFSYDGANNLRTAVDRNGRQRSFGYDNLYRTTSETWQTGTPVNPTFGFTYDAIGNLTGVTDSSPLGTNFQFTYDARNQLQLERQTAKVNNASFILDRDYDTEGRRTRTSINIGGTIVPGALNSGGTISGGVRDLVNAYAYDRQDRLTSVSQVSASGGNAVAPKFVAFTYDIASQMTDMRRYSSTFANAPDLEVHSRYTFDGAARLNSITHARSEIAVGEAWNGTSALPASITPAQTIAAYHFGYDRDNRLTAMASYTDRFRTTYSYDFADQLTGATSSAIAGLAAPSPLPLAESYNLDLNGNRRSSAGASQSASGTHNRLQTDGTFNYTYDNEGNTLTKTRIATGAVTEFVWDHRNRLVGVLEKASASAAVNRQTTYAYDVFDRKTLDRFDSDGIPGSNRDELWVNDGEHPILQYRDSDGAGTAQPYRLANRYLHGAVVDQILADEQYASGTGPVLSGTVVSTTAGTTFWTVADHLGSVRDLVDNNGITRQHVVYDSFGRRLSEVDRNAAGTIIASTDASAVDTIFGYTGREWDKDTSLQYNRARWYDPATGRWLSQDPIGFAAGDANLYRYVGNQPMTKTDPSGLQPPQHYDELSPSPPSFPVGGFGGMGGLASSAIASAEYQRFKYGDPATNGGMIVFSGNEARKYLGIDVYEYQWKKVPGLTILGFQNNLSVPARSYTRDYNNLYQGCMGLAKIRLDTGNREAFDIPSTRAFASYEAALAAQKQLVQSSLSDTRIVIWAYQDNHLNADLVSFLLPGSRDEYDFDRLRPIRGGLDGVRRRGRLTVFDFVTVHQKPDGSVLFYETMPYGGSRNNTGLDVHHKCKLYPAERAGTIYFVVPIKNHPRAPLSPLGDIPVR